MADTGSVTNLLHQLKDGAEGDVQQEIWNRYFNKLVRMAGNRLAKNQRRVEDEEDIVLSALGSFFNRAKEGQFPQLADRTSLWPLLVAITVCKTRDLQRRQNAGKRDVRRTVAAASAGETNWLLQIQGEEVSPETAAAAAEEAERMIAALEKESLQNVARMKLDGYTNAEIAQQEGVMERSIERRLVLIRQIWTELAEASEEHDG